MLNILVQITVQNPETGRQATASVEKAGSVPSIADAASEACSMAAAATCAVNTESVRA